MLSWKRIMLRFFVSGSTAEHCLCAHIREQSGFFCVFLWSCRAPPTCCATLWESARDGSSFHFQSFPLCLLLSWHSFHNSCPVFFSPSLPHPRSNLPPKCQKCSVRRIPYVPYESVLLLLSNWQAKDFIRRVNLCYAVAVRCGRLCWRNTSPPPPSLCMSLAAQTWSVKCIVHRWELIICFLLFWFFFLNFVFPSVWLSLPSSVLIWQLLCLWASISVALFSQTDGNRWNTSFARFWWMAAIIRLGKRKKLFSL